MLGYAVRSLWPVAAAVVFIAAAFFFVRAYPDIAPETRFTAAELAIQRAGGQGSRRAEARSIRASRRSTATWTASATASEPSSNIRGDTASATPA